MPRHRWKVKVQSETGQVAEREVRANWSPEHSLTESSVLEAAAAEAWLASGKRTHYKGISAELVD